MTGTILRGGWVLDAARGEFAIDDVRWENGRITDAIECNGDVVIDVAGRYVVPGLIDLHTHIFHGQDIGVEADAVAFAAGTTMLVDAGSAGAHLLGAFRASTVDRSSVDVRAFVNIATIGTTSVRLGGELRSPWYVSETEAINAIERNRDFVVGVKVRASADVGGEFAAPALATARRVADIVALPLMVHLGPAPVGINEIADLLHEGDVLTHAFTGWENNRIIGSDGRLLASVRAARDRGALLDVGHGKTGFSLDVARRLFEEGTLPDTISTDIHAYSREHVVDLPTVLSKFLAIGITLPEVLKRATITSAGVVGSDAGTLLPGKPADIAVFDLLRGEFIFNDGFGGSVKGSARLNTSLTVCRGSIVFNEITQGVSQNSGASSPVGVEF